MALRILQLSDIHFSTKFDDDKAVHLDVRDQLISDLRDVVVPQSGNINNVLIAGDIAFSGVRGEYEDAARWLEQVTSVCGCKATDVLMVPGNHDVDRKRILPIMRSIHRRLRTCSTPEAKHELVEVAAQNDGALMDKLSAYQAFASGYACHFESPSRPHWSRVFPLERNLFLKFVGLTTVQVCDSEDQKGGMLLGAHQYILDRTPRVEIVLIMHHPPEWIKDRQDAFQYLDSRARVQIFGHEHFQEIQSVSNVNQETRLVICSGAVTPENAVAPYIYRYNVLEFRIVGEPDDPCLSITIYPRVWIPEATRFVADTARLGGRESTTFRLGCPQFRLPPPDAQGPGAQITSPEPEDADAFVRTKYFFWRYLSWQQQLKVLVESELLPAVSDPPGFQMLARMALERARTDGKMPSVWDKIMLFVPEDKKEPNPFTALNS